MNILVVAPMEEECTNFKVALSKKPHKNKYRVIHSGVGMANAASAVSTEVINISSDKKRFYDLIAVIGYAASSQIGPNHKPFEQGELVIPSKARYSTPLFFPIPEEIQVPELTQEYELQGSDPVTILTSDIFITKNSIPPYNKPALYDMEATSICQVAQEFNIPVVVLKFISDIPETQTPQSFSKFVETHSNFAPFLYYLESLSSL